MPSQLGHSKYRGGIGTPRTFGGGWVYALMCEGETGGFIKIGCSSNPLKRWKDIVGKGENPEPLKRIAVYHGGSMQGAFNLERALHKVFQNRRVFGEWFRFDFRNPEDKKEFQIGCKLYLTNGWWESFRPKDLERIKHQKAA